MREYKEVRALQDQEYQESLRIDKAKVCFMYSYTTFIIHNCFSSYCNNTGTCKRTSRSQYCYLPKKFVNVCPVHRLFKFEELRYNYFCAHNFLSFNHNANSFAKSGTMQVYLFKVVWSLVYLSLMVENLNVSFLALLSKV